jgi:hypothetical protein
MPYLFILVLVLFSSSTYAKGLPVLENRTPHPLYVGVLGGFGSTTWRGLVPEAENQNPALRISMPTNSSEGGFLWGVFVGYELTRYFAFEASYVDYPDATVIFDVGSLFAFDHDGQTEFKTKTSTLSFIGKLMVSIPQTKLRIYSGAGVSGIHRQDLLKDETRVAPSFVMGCNYPITPHIDGHIGASFTAGYGEATLNPANDFIPFLYSIVFKLAYRI